MNKFAWNIKHEKEYKIDKDKMAKYRITRSLDTAFPTVEKVSL